MANYRIFGDACIGRWVASAMVCMALYATPAHAVWTYDLAAQIAMHDGIVAACGKIEPRIHAVLKDEWSRKVRILGSKAIRSARKSSEYLHTYQDMLLEDLASTWGDTEEQAHACERVYINLSKAAGTPRQWWRDRLCADVPMDSEEQPMTRQRCWAGPRAEVSFENTMSHARISILRLAPSSDLSFPRAGIFPQWSEPGHRIVSISEAVHVWAIPESVDFEWKEWPRTIPSQLKDKRDLESVRLYVDGVRHKVQRKRAHLVIRGRIPPEVIAEALQADRAGKAHQSHSASLKLFFIFMQDGLRFRWEQWRGNCIKQYGGDAIDLPRDQLLSGDWICGEPEPTPCCGKTNAN